MLRLSMARCGRVARALAAAVALFGAAAAASAQDVGTLVPVERLLARPGGDDLLEVMSVMRVTMTSAEAGGAGDSRQARSVEREVAIVHLGEPNRSGRYFDVGRVAVRTDSLFKVVYVASTDLGFVERLGTIALPRSDGGRPVNMLHVRYAQTGTGGVTEDLLFALDSEQELVPVPIGSADLSGLLDDGEYLCCGRFTRFDWEDVESTVYVTRNGRPGVTHAIHVHYRVSGGFEPEAGTGRVVPRFRLEATEVGGRESVEAE